MEESVDILICNFESMKKESRIKLDNMLETIYCKI